MVIGCTDSDQTPKPPWRARKEAYVSRLRQADRSVLLVTGSDKPYNSRATLADYRRFGESVWDRFAGGVAEAGAGFGGRRGLASRYPP